MTNKELADKIESVIPQVLPKYEPGMLIDWPDRAKGLALSLAADLIRDLPNPTPQPKSDEQQMREIVEQHSDLFGAKLRYHKQYGQFQAFAMNSACIHHWMNCGEELAMDIIRGIVKAKCDEIGRGHWKPTGEANLNGKWQYHWSGQTHYVADELAAIDELLTELAKQN